MKNLLYISGGIIFLLMSNSCHPDHLAFTEEPEENLQYHNAISARSDTTDHKDTDPPKDRDHWRPIRPKK